MSENEKDSFLTLEDRLVAKYGELVEFSELVSLLKYKSPLALKRAIAAKQLDIELSRIGTRKVVATRDVVKLLIKAGINPRPGNSDNSPS
ncbi:hypothetical protein MCEMSHM24_03703 [Comamonadaceae bacterium]